MPPIASRPPYPHGPQFVAFHGSPPAGVRQALINLSRPEAESWARQFESGTAHPGDYFWSIPREHLPPNSGVADMPLPQGNPLELEVGQTVSYHDLATAGPGAYEGVAFVVAGRRYADSWATGNLFRIQADSDGRPQCYHLPEDAWQGNLVGNRSGALLILHVPTGDTAMPPEPPGTRPHCPLCLRYAAHIVAGDRHRTVARGSEWCRGSEVAASLAGLLSTAVCPRCTRACWKSDIRTHTTVDGSVTGCEDCRDTLARLYTHGALPEDLRFGVELETESLAYEDEAAELAKGRKLDHHRSGRGKVPASIRDGWAAKHDGSLRGPVHRHRGNHKNAEVISPPMPFTPEALEEVQVMTRELRYKGARHAARCGLHVHVDCTALSAEHVKSLMEWWYAAQPAVLRALPPWEYRTRFCVSTPASLMTELRYPAYTTKDLIAGVRGNERYNAVNLNSLRKHGTVEFRFFNGSVHAAKVTAYIEFCVRLVSHASRHLAGGRPPDAFTRDRAGMAKLLDVLGFTPGRTSQRWHLLGALATEEDRPGPVPAVGVARTAEAVAPAEQFPDPDEDEDDPFADDV